MSRDQQLPRLWVGMYYLGGSGHYNVLLNRITNGAAAAGGGVFRFWELAELHRYK